MARSRTAGGKGVSLETLSKLALALPGVEAGTSYGTLAFKVQKLFARVREDGETLAIRADFDERETLMGADPEIFFVTDHYLNYPMVLVRLAKIDAAGLAPLLEGAWRFSAPKKLLAARDGAPQEKGDAGATKKRRKATARRR